MSKRDHATIGRRIVVPIANPASAKPLLTIAARIAAASNGQIDLATIAGSDRSEADKAAALAALQTASQIGTEYGVAVDCRIAVSDDPATGVLDAVAAVDASLVLMGWRQESSTTDVFGRLIDQVVGRSTVPLAVVRPGSVPFRRVVMPLSADHLLPGGESGLGLAAAVTEGLSVHASEPTTLLRTGAREINLSDDLVRLGDRVHHDPRRTDQAVGAAARPDDVVVAAVAPTASGLRAATTHLAWAAPHTTLLVAIDVGPRREPDRALASAVAGAGAPPPSVRGRDLQDVRIMVTVRSDDEQRIEAETLDVVLKHAGQCENLMAWWPTGEVRPHLRATVTVHAKDVNTAIGAVMGVVHESPDLRGAEITYDVESSRGPASVTSSKPASDAT